MRRAHSLLPYLVGTSLVAAVGAAIAAVHAQTTPPTSAGPYVLDAGHLLSASLMFLTDATYPTVQIVVMEGRTRAEGGADYSAVWLPQVLLRNNHPETARIDEDDGGRALGREQRAARHAGGGGSGSLPGSCRPDRLANLFRFGTYRIEHDRAFAVDEHGRRPRRDAKGPRRLLVRIHE
jgi:hypothetical protein